jgi:hypothetical protein
MFHYLVGGGVGFLAGAFMPGVLRKIKAYFVKETAAVKADVAKKL